MRLEVEKIMETKDWRNKNFQPKQLVLILKEEHKSPSEIKIYFAEKVIIFEKQLFEVLPYLTFEGDPKESLETFKLMPSLALERRYDYYYILPKETNLVDYIQTPE